MNFLGLPSVKFSKIWKTGGKYFSLVGARFPGKCTTPVFAAVRDINLQKSKKTACTNPTFLRLKFVSHTTCCENFGRLHGRKFKKMTSKKI